jgi:hypothetical protein
VRFGGERWRVERWGWPVRGFELTQESLEYDAEEMRSAWGVEGDDVTWSEK